MMPTRARSILRVNLVVLLSALLASPAALAARHHRGAAKARHRAAASLAAKRQSLPKHTSANPASTPASTSDASAPSGETPPALAASAVPEMATPESSQLSDVPATGEATKDATAASEAEAPVTTEQPAADAVATPPAADLGPVYVEHLGPSSYPGKMRGLYGGSLWLEPSFQGLQWPYMKRSGVGVSGSIWIDDSYEGIARDYSGSDAHLSRTDMWLQQGRGVLRITPAYVSGSFFIQGQIELIGNLCQVQGSGDICTAVGTFSTDDLWLRIGQWNRWDLKLGRFEGWELYHTGMGLDINTFERLGATNAAITNAPSGLDAPEYYGVSFLQYRPAAGQGIGYVAFHAYPSSFLRFEFLGELGTDLSNSNQGHNYLGARPVAIFDVGWLKIRAGGEYERQTRGTPQMWNSSANAMEDSKYKVTRKGLGMSFQLVFEPWVEFGGNIARGYQTALDDVGSAQNGGALNYTRTSVGGFANVRLAPLWLAGVGMNWTVNYDGHYYSGASNSNYTAQLQGFLALQYLLAKQLFIKAVFGYSRADFEASDFNIPIWSNYMYSGRLRMMYLY